MKNTARTFSLSIAALAIAFSASACGGPAASSEATASGSPASSSPAAPTASPTASLSVSEQFGKDVMTPKKLDLSGLVMPADVKGKFVDGGAGVGKALENYVTVSTSYPELNKGSHINSAADYPMFENLRPLMTPALYEDALHLYVQPAGTAIIPNYANLDGKGLNTLAQGYVLPDDKGTVWQWSNEKATARLLSANGVDGVVIKLPVRFSFNTVNGKGIVSLYASRQYRFVQAANGAWLLSDTQWSSADQRSTKDSEMLLKAESPVDSF